MSWIHVVAPCVAAAVLGAAAGRSSAAATMRRLRAQNSVLAYEASHDRLTGLLNRAGLEDAYTTAGRRHRYLIVVDLNRFKAVNDWYGHPAGDRLLAALGTRLAELATRHGGWAGRLGGDECALVVPDTTRTVVETVAFEVASTISVAHTPGAHLQVGGSAGVASAPPGRSWACALSDADIALYHAKTDGGGAAFFVPGMFYPDRRGSRRRGRDARRPS
ncbi:GGDEF domain-containing protein [Couchioplanes azureus]|uniref:GGDEF domain-containing protein n=1 Tax=Couchioplanes caeruleus TaxID=56438 RepID=UPI0016704801|nr:GGDEF domain-containing protein [Couchioplanes caeruleus]GGQ83566.1 hypothetical protein GCM10010166_62150 [Couchioplanes caeruleus subsp. azureus]